AGISPRWKPAKRSEDTSENRKGKFEFRNSNFEIPLIPGFPCRFLWLARGDDERYWRASLHGGGRRSDQKTPRKIGKGNSNFEIRISKFPLSQASLAVSFGSLGETTSDIGGHLSTAEAGEAIRRHLGK